MKKTIRFLALMLIISTLFTSLGSFAFATEEALFSEETIAVTEETAPTNETEDIAVNEEELNRIYESIAAEQALQQQTELSPATTADGIGYYVITADRLNVRWGPSTGHIITSYAYVGEKYYVYEISGKWGKIAENRWISLDYAHSLKNKVYSISDYGINFIKKYEGYSEFKFWDYSQWTIGYGCACEEDDYPNGITEPEALALLKRVVVKYELYVDDYLAKYNITVDQAQYDALVSISYNCGNIWIVDGKGEAIKRILLDGIDKYESGDIIYAFTTTCVTAGGQFLQGLYNRRKAEAEMFMRAWGSYFYNDVSRWAWYNNSVGYCTRLYYMSGTGNRTFSPDASLTREQLVQIMYNYSGASGYDGNTAYWDVPSNEWYAPAVHWAQVCGIMSGVGDGEFGVGMPVTREMFVTVLYNFSNWLYVDTTASSDYEKYYKDSGEISSWAARAVNWALTKGVICGVADYTLAPKGVSSRASAAMMFCNYDKKVLGLNV